MSGSAKTFSIAEEIERLLLFAEENDMLEPLDVIPARNALLDLFQVDVPYSGSRDDIINKNYAEEDGKDEEVSDEVDDELLNSPSKILNRMLDYAADKGLLPANHTTQRDLMDARIMGLLMPRQSEVARKFWQTAEEQSIEKATEQFYHLSQCSNYIRLDRIANNEYWTSTTDYGDLEITVNLSKPEKDPEEIAALKDAPAMHYPKCLLCLENVGYAGRIDHPARQNHRVIPLELNEEAWYLQYSPYVYYNEHCIVLSKHHKPMQINETVFQKLLQFVQQFPHYFVGSNADLPIVGGSILNHDHFQGGRHTFAMEKAPAEANYVHTDFPDVSVARIKWPMSVVRLTSANPKQVGSLASRILDSWKQYTDTSAEILAFSGEGEQRVPHNTVTPIARKNKQGLYELDLVLRNNRTSAEHPEGIFHPHRPLHPIKKENIGLIEVMGLAVLPGRLIDELEKIVAILTGEIEVLHQAQDDEQDVLHKHLPWIHSMIDQYGTYLAEKEAWNCVRAEVGGKFTEVLQDAGVFKRTREGQQAFDQFMRQAGFSSKG